jgi:hypothetical protein
LADESARGPGTRTRTSTLKRVGRRALLPSTGAERCSNACRSHPLPVGTPASHRRGPPGRCPLPLATPDARYGPRTASASAVLPSLPWAARRRPNPSCLSVHRPPAGGRRSGTKPNHVFQATRLPFDPGSPNDVLRGGALEPEPRTLCRKLQAKAHAYSPARFPAPSAEGLSLSGGASIRSSAFSS